MFASVVITASPHHLITIDAMDSETLERLELKIAYLEKANAELSDVVYRQQREIAALEDRFSKLKDRLDALAASPSAYSADDEKPPHY